jgi:hypothetical protein
MRSATDDVRLGVQGVFCRLAHSTITAVIWLRIDRIRLEPVSVDSRTGLCQHREYGIWGRTFWFSSAGCQLRE